MRPRVLGLGNELLGDDAVGIEAARRVKQELTDQVDVAETGVYGLALLDVILGCRQLIIIDAIKTGRLPVGSVIELDPGSFDRVPAPSPHYSGLPEMQALAETLHLDYPEAVVVLAVEIRDGVGFGEPMHPAVVKAIDQVVRRVRQQLTQWRHQELRGSAAVDSSAFNEESTVLPKTDPNGLRRGVPNETA